MSISDSNIQTLNYIWIFFVIVILGSAGFGFYLVYDIKNKPLLEQDIYYSSWKHFEDVYLLESDEDDNNIITSQEIKNFKSRWLKHHNWHIRDNYSQIYDVNSNKITNTQFIKAIGKDDG